MSASDYGGPSPQNLGANKRSFQLRHFATLLQVATISTNGENGTVFQPTHNQLLRT